MSKTVLLKKIQFCVSTHFSSIWPIDRTLSGPATPSHKWPGSDGNEGILCILQMEPYCLVSQPEHSFGKSYPSVEVHSVYFTAPPPPPQSTGQDTLRVPLGVHLTPQTKYILTSIFLQALLHMGQMNYMYFLYTLLSYDLSNLLQTHVHFVTELTRVTSRLPLKNFWKTSLQ